MCTRSLYSSFLKLVAVVHLHIPLNSVGTKTIVRVLHCVAVGVRCDDWDREYKGENNYSVFATERTIRLVAYINM
jgi:hypothetical protein